MVNERFIELLAKKLSDEIDESEAEELKFLLADDEECRQQYNFFKTYWNQDQEQCSNSDLLFHNIKSRIGVVDEVITEAIAPKRLYRIPLFWRSVAAIFLAGICIYVFYYCYQFSANSKVVNTLELTKTPSRSRSKIFLSDGSVVTLNSETTLKYPATFNGATREVYLDGEAFFSVAKDHAHPFIVHAGKMSIKVLGTAFDVKYYANDTHSETTLIRGAIEVTMADRPSDRIILKPNEKLILNSASIRRRKTRGKLIAVNDTTSTNYALTNLTHLKSNDTTIVETSWVNNKLVFKDEPFTDLANQMQRWYGIKVKFKNNNVKDYHFTGVFEKESITQALDALKMIETFTYKYKNETVYIY